MQDRPRVDMEEVSMDEVSQSDFIEIDLNDVQVADAPRAEITNAVQAFKMTMQRSVIDPVVRQYQPGKNLAAAVGHGLFCDKDGLSLKATVKTVASAGVAGAASMFSFKPAKDAVLYLTDLITGGATTYFPAQDAVITLSQFGNVTRTIIVVNFMARSMFDKYFTKTNEDVVYLMVETPRGPAVVRVPRSLGEKIADAAKVGGRKLFDLISAIGSNFPVLFTLIETNPAMAFTSFVAFIPLSLYGMDNLKLHPETVYAARSAEVNYMRKQLQTFCLLPRAKQISIMNKIKEMEEGNHPNKDKMIYGMLLNLSKPEEAAGENDIVHIMENHADEWYKEITAKGLGALCGFSQLPFTEASGVSIARLFADPTSAGAIAAGVISAIISFLPTVGLGYKGGESVGKKMFYKHPSLGLMLNPELRDTLKWLVLGINLFAGGTSIKFTYDAAKDLANLCNLSAEATRILQGSLIGVNYTASSIAFGQFMIDAMDELVVFLSRHYADEESQRLLEFVNGYTQLIGVIDNMNVENYCELMVRWKMAGPSQLKNTLHAIFSEQIKSDVAYQAFQRDLSKMHDLVNGLTDSNTVVLGDRLTNDTYIVTPNFLDRHVGLRRRHLPQDGAGDVEMDIGTQFDRHSQAL